MSRMPEENDVESDEEEEELDESKKEELKREEELRKQKLEKEGIQYNIYSIWDWNEEDNMKINDTCREIAKKFNVEIQCLNKSFELKGKSFEQLNEARNTLLRLIIAKASTAKQTLVTSIRPKKIVKNVKLETAPLLDEKEKVQPMITEEDLKGLKGIFSFRIRNFNEVLGRNILTCDYWQDICKECKVYGNLDENRWRIEITSGKRKDVNEALRKLRQLEDIYLRDPFDKKRIPIVYHPIPTQLFNICFRARPVNVNDEVTYVLDYTIPKISDAILQRNPNPAENLRNFNFNKMKEFKKGLEYVRVYKGEVRFYGSLGESWFSNVDYDVKKSLWKYTDLDNLISKHGVKSSFNEIATRNYDLAVKGFTQVLGEGSAPIDMTEYFEIRADARNSPQIDFSDVYMYVNVANVSLDKVMLEWDPLLNVDWTILDRNFDFSMVLATRRAIRHTVKPFITFKKKLSVSPRHETISFENVENFLYVKSINFKQVSRFKLNKSFIAELACVEDVPLDKECNKIIGKTGYGKAYFTIEIYDENHRKKFKQNASLGSGEMVDWTVNDILGEEPGLSNMVELVSTMLRLVELCHKLTES